MIAIRWKEESKVKAVPKKIFASSSRRCTPGRSPSRTGPISSPGGAGPRTQAATPSGSQSSHFLSVEGQDVCVRVYEHASKISAAPGLSLLDSLEERIHSLKKRRSSKDIHRPTEKMQQLLLCFLIPETTSGGARVCNAGDVRVRVHLCYDTVHRGHV